MPDLVPEMVQFLVPDLVPDNAWYWLVLAGTFWYWLVLAGTGWYWLEPIGILLNSYRILRHPVESYGIHWIPSISALPMLDLRISAVPGASRKCRLLVLRQDWMKFDDFCANSSEFSVPRPKS